jgi:predicted ATPase/class 3 adenylate cyclase
MERDAASDASFGRWLRRRRKTRDLTQDALAEQVGCSVATIRKIETDERRPSRQIAELLADVLAIAPGERAAFLQAARAELAVDRLSAPPPPIGPAAAHARVRPLPSGTVTFLFTDIEGSSRLWERHPQAMPDALARHDAILRTAIEERDGVVFRTVGDAVCAAFARAPAALAAALAAQRALRDASWPATGPIRVRIALHTGVVEVRAGDYLGQSLNRVARLLATGHGGQIVLSRATQELVADHLPPDVALRDLGTQQLRDLSRPEQVFQVVAADLPADFPPLAQPAVRRVSLPHPLTPLIGRAVELAEVGRLLRRAECRLLTIVGPGGMGKTRLAIAAAAEQGDAFPDGVCFVALAPLTAPEFIVPAIAAAIGFAFYGPIEPKTQLLNYVREKALLLVLDNVEQLLSGAGLLSELLQYAPAVKLLVTSRERLQLQGEWVVDLQGLPVPPPPSRMAERSTLARGQGRAGVETYSAVTLFVKSAQRARMGFALSEQNQVDIARVCRLVEGLPLGIELAATWVPTLSCQEIAQQIERNIDFLAVSIRDLPERHRSIRAVFDHSWKLLTREERQVLQRLSVFRGGFTREAAEQVAGASLPLLSLLVSKSLLRRLAAGRYDLHELLRQYAGARLADDPAAQSETRARYSRHYAERLQRWETQLIGPRQREVFTEMGAEIDNLRQAWSWMLVQRQIAEMHQSLHGLWLFYHLQDWYQEGATLFGQAVETLKAWREAEPGTNATPQTVLLGHILAKQGWFCYCLGQHEAQARARDLLHQSLALLRLATDGAANAVPSVRVALADALAYLGTIDYQQGKYVEARQYLLESLALNRFLNHQWRIAYCLEDLGNIDRLQGEDWPAQQRYHESLEIWRSLGDAVGIAYSLRSLGAVATTLGQYAEAQALLREGLAVGRTTGLRWAIGLGLKDLGVLAHAVGNYTEAQQLLRESLALFKDIGSPWSIARTLNDLGWTVCALGMHAEAKQAFLESLKIATELQAASITADALIGIAALDAKEGSIISALELLGHIRHYPISSQEAKDRAERLRAEVVAQLTPQQIEVAQARVQAKTFEAVVAEILSAQ